MPTNKVSIVPVHLEPTDCPPLKTIRVIQAKQFKVSFYHGIKNHIIQTVMQELMKHDS